MGWGCRRPGKEQVWQCSLAVVFAAALVISPWTLRNYFTFGEFVPIRTDRQLGEKLLYAKLNLGSRSALRDGS